MMYKLNTSLHVLSHFVSRVPVSSTSKLWHSHAASSRTRLFLTGALGSILVCAVVLLGGATRAQDPRPQALQGIGPAPNPEFGPNANLDLEKPHLLAGSYYSMRGGLKATLLLNNKGPRPLEVRPTLFSLAGERLDIQPVIVEGNSFRMIDLREWVMVGGPSFEQGSIQLFHPGRDLVLGAQIYLVDDVHSLIFDEKLTEITNGGPARLEGIWWLPSASAQALVTLSNTSDASLTVTTRLMGSAPNHADSTTLDLAPHETRVIDVSRDSRSSIGALSIEHSGTGGPLVARAMVQDLRTGYSSTVQFSAPQKGKSSRLEGAGLRLRGASGESLNPIVVARNVGDAATTLRGRVPYTTADGDVRFVRIAAIRLAPGEAKVIQLDRTSEIDRIPSEVEIAGLEFEHAGAPGSVIMAAHSMSSDGNQVYRVPMWDPLAQRSPTGGYPWYVEGTSSTTVYIKNITRREQKYMAHLVYPGGTYVFGQQTVKGGQTVEIDLRTLRDNQVPDEAGRTIPLNVSRGQIKWSLKPTRKSSTTDPDESLALIGRSEQTDTVQGISSNYSCQSCCTDGFLFGEVSPNSVQLEVGDQVQLTAYETSQDCYGNIVPSQHSANWSTSNTSVASVSGGLVTANGTGNVSISARWFVTEHFSDPGCAEGGPLATGEVRDDLTILAAPGCENGCGSLWHYNTSSAGIVVQPKVTVSKIQYKGPNNSTFTDATSTLYVLKGTQVTFKAIPNPVTATFPSGKPTWSGTSSATGTGETVSVTFGTVSSNTSDFKTVIATSGNSMTVNVIVYDLNLVFTPAVDFAGRSYDHFGIEEQVSLSFTATPAVTVQQIGGLRWDFVTTGNRGQLTNVTDEGTADYSAPDTANSIIFKILVLDGPSKNLGFQQGIVIVEPSGGFITKLSGPKHIANTWSTGFKGVIHITPANVSFFNLLFQEGSCPIVLSGWLNTNEFNIPHAQGPMNRITSKNEVDFEDNIFTGVKSPPYGTGTWHWDIPWKVVTNSNRSISIGTFRQLATADNNGKAVITKGGRSQESNAADPTSDW